MSNDEEDEEDIQPAVPPHRNPVGPAKDAGAVRDSHGQQHMQGKNIYSCNGILLMYCRGWQRKNIQAEAYWKKYKG